MKTIELNLIEVVRVGGGYTVCQCRADTPKKIFESNKSGVDEECCKEWCCGFIIGTDTHDGKYYWYDADKASKGVVKECVKL